MQAGGISGVRLTFRREDAERAFSWAAAILDKGYQVFFQPVGTAFYSDMELLRLVERVNRLRPFAFYMVDTLGSMYPGQVTRQFHLIHENMDPAIRLGFHGHNNLQLAFSNAQVLLGIQAKRQLILDSSVYGMGRGAGNLPTELITRYINQNIQSRYNVGMVMDIYDEYIAPLRREYQWGYSMAYHLAASHACHPNYAAYLINKQTLSMQDRESILRAIPQDQRVEFDKALVRRLYARHQSRHIDDTRAVEELAGLMAGRKLLVLAPGESLRTREAQVLGFIQREHPLVLAVNFADPQVPGGGVLRQQPQAPGHRRGPAAGAARGAAGVHLQPGGPGGPGLPAGGLRPLPEQRPHGGGQRRADAFKAAGPVPAPAGGAGGVRRLFGTGLLQPGGHLGPQRRRRLGAPAPHWGAAFPAALGAHLPDALGL